MEIIWKPVRGYEGLYEVSNDGQVRTVARYIEVKGKSGGIRTHPIRAKQKTPNASKQGYLTIALVINGVTKNTLLHRIICEAYMPNPENKRCVNHKNGIKTDNRLENLEWATHYENNKHARDTNLWHPNHMVSTEFANSVLYMRSIGKKYKEIASSLKSTEGIIGGILRGQTHRKTVSQLQGIH